MGKGLLIVGAGMYGLVVKEIAESLNRFDKIAFIDDGRRITPNGIEVLGTMQDIEGFSNEYDSVIVAIGNPKFRLNLLQKLKTTTYEIVSLVSPYAYVSPSAQVGKGCVVEPMAVVHSEVKLAAGCLISAGAVVNHGSVCEEVVHVDCNATVEGDLVVPTGMKVLSGQVFKRVVLNS